MKEITGLWAFFARLYFSFTPAHKLWYLSYSIKILTSAARGPKPFYADTNLLFMRNMTIALWVQCSIFIALLGIGEVLHAQSAAYFQYTVRDGLPSNLVYCCVQDRRGLLWFGTDKGLACFDGQRFRTYGMQDGLPDPEVLWMKEDSKGRLWLCCFGKKPCYMLNGKIITEKEDPLLIQVDAGYGTGKIFEDSKGKIWYITRTNKVYIIYRNQVEKLNIYRFIHDITQIKDNIFIWSSNNVYIMKVNTGEIIDSIQYNRNNGNDRTTLLTVTCGNNLFQSQNGKFYHLKYDGHNLFSVADENSKIRPVLVDKKGYFWAYSPDQGAISFYRWNINFYDYKTYLNGKKITTFIEDKNGTFWFGTLDEGVFVLTQNYPLNYNSNNFNSLNIRMITQLKNSTTVVGDDGGFVYNLKDEKKTNASPNNEKVKYNRVIKIISNTESNNYWIVTEKGIVSYCNNSILNTIETDGVSIKDAIRQGNLLWFSSATRLSYINLSYNKLVVHYLIARRFTVLNLDSDNNIWAGSINGLYAQKDSFQYNWGQKFPELAQRIVAMESAGPGKVWVVTPKDGLMRITVSNGEILSLEKTGMSLKIPIQNIQSLFAEPNGRLWMATNRGVYGLEPSSGKIIHFDTHDGLLNDDVNTVLVHQDTLWVGTVAGLTRIALRPPDDDGNFRTLISAMRYTFEKQDIVNWFMDSVEHRSDIFIPKEAANLEFDLAGLDYQRQDNLDFEVEQTTKALPLHQMTWDNLFSILYTNTVTHIQNDNATYRLGSFFPAGRYKLKVSAIKSSGVRSHLPDEWIIYKPPYWYQVIWFHLAILMAIFALLWRFYQTQKNLIKTKEEASTLQLMALQSQLNPHFIGNSVNSIQQFLHPPDPYKASEYISLFTRLLRNTMHFSEKTFVTFEEEYNYVREYLEMTKLRLENQFTYELIGKEDIPMDALFPSMLLQPLLENATIHGISPDGATHCVLVFSMDMGIIKCQLTDNGLGINYTKNKKEQMAVRRVSKGVTLLQKKISSINILYKLNLALIIEDLSELGGHNRGTRATITFKLRKNEGKNVA